jgi:hypothetical protein
MTIERNIITTFLILTTFTLAVLSCQNAKDKKMKNERNEDELRSNFCDKKNLIENDTIVISREHKPNSVFCDLDGDNLIDTVKIVQNTGNNKYGLKMTFGNKKVKYLGMGEDILGQGFDDINWVGIFEKAPKGVTYYNNVNEDGEIISEEDIKEKDKIKLPNDGIFIHQSESCGGGVIYLNKEKFEWIQQE